MATTDKAAVATGAEVGDSLRRRNVAASQPAPQHIVQVDDKKKLQKKVREPENAMPPSRPYDAATSSLTLSLLPGAFIPPNPR